MPIKQKGLILYPILSYMIVGYCFKAHNDIGRFGREKQYADFIEKLFKNSRINYKRELPIADSGNIIDFLIDEKIILELKSKRIITKADYYQTHRYLQATGMKLAILVNFRSEYLNPKRIILKETN